MFVKENICKKWLYFLKVDTFKWTIGLEFYNMYDKRRQNPYQNKHPHIPDFAIKDIAIGLDAL